MFLLVLKRIDLRQNSDTQTLAFRDRVKSWMSKWTVANNFNPILSTDMHANNADINLWVTRFEQNFKSAIGEVFPDRGIRDDFEFMFEVYRLTFGKEAEYLMTRIVKLSTI